MEKFTGPKASESFERFKDKVKQNITTFLSSEKKRNGLKYAAIFGSGILVGAKIGGYRSGPSIPEPEIGVSTSQTYEPEIDPSVTTTEVTDSPTVSTQQAPTGTNSESLLLSSYKVVAKGLNLRSSPDTTVDNKLLSLHNGEQVFTSPDTFISVNGITWGKVKYLNPETNTYIEGYISMSPDYVEADLTNPSFYYEVNQNLVDTSNKKMITANTVNVRSTPSTQLEPIGKLNGGTRVVIIPGEKASETLTNGNVRSWQKILTINPQNNQPTEAWIADDYLKDLPSIYGYQDINITEQDLSRISDYIHTWENAPIYSYIHDPNTTVSYNNPLVKNHVTVDGKNYICYPESNGTKNYGYGVNINQNGIPNPQTVERFKELGYDVTGEEYLQPYTSTLPVDVVDIVSEEYTKKSIANIKKCLQERNIRFTKSELLGLASICYQFGQEPTFINYFLDSFEKYGGNTQELRDNFVTKGGTHIFIRVNGADDPVQRAVSYWKGFHEGRFIMGTGPEKEIYFDDYVPQNTVEDMEH